MKKVTIIFAVLTIIAGTGAYAKTGDKVSKVVQASFKKSFLNAENVTWESAEEYYYARFQLNGKSVDAAYNENGELVGVSRKLLLSDIPLKVSQSLQSEYSDYVIDNTIIEVVFEGQTYYTARVENATKILKLKCLSDGQIYIEKKIKK